MTGMDERLAKVAEVLAPVFWPHYPTIEKVAQALKPLLTEWQAEGEARAWDEGYSTCLGDFDIAARREARSRNPYRASPRREDHTGCARRVENGVVHYACGISVPRGAYEGGVYAEHVRRRAALDGAQS